MVATHRLRMPASEDQIRAMRAGDLLYIDGEIVVTAGLPTHERIAEYLDAGRPLPVELRGAAFLHLGSYNRETDGRFEILYMNPTTSTRFNPFMPGFIRRLGLRITGGKGGLNRACADAMKEVGCVYVSFLGGGAALHSAAIKEVVTVAWPDLVAHYRLVKLRVENLGPLTVGIDAHGTSLYEDLTREAKDKLPAIMERLAAARSKA
jgi:fumarate hydratase subunit beta